MSITIRILVMFARIFLGLAIGVVFTLVLDFIGRLGK